MIEVMNAVVVEVEYCSRQNKVKKKTNLSW